MSDLALPLTGLLALGAWHGINPAMGWLFAVSLGLQEENGRAVWRALGPLALGHAVAVGAVVLLGVVIGRVIPAVHLRWLVAAVLIGFGVYRLIRRGHPRWVGMRVGSKDLVFWSALMASAHGAGLMVLPFVLATSPLEIAAHNSMRGGASAQLAMSSASGVPTGDAWSSDHSAHLLKGLDAKGRSEFTRGEASLLGLGVWATVVHAAAYLLVTGSIAAVVYYKLGLRLLRQAWLNLDVIWAGALILTGLLTPLL